ncbi:hypothetical protein GGI43DRAFT_166927 [Trichoderma evansii]
MDQGVIGKRLWDILTFLVLFCLYSFGFSNAILTAVTEWRGIWRAVINGCYGHRYMKKLEATQKHCFALTG